MAQPQDDQFNLPTLDVKWTYSEPVAGPAMGYSLTLNPGNFTAHVTTSGINDVVADFTRLLQDRVFDQWVTEIGITQSNTFAVGQEAGLLVVENNTTYIFFAKSRQAGGSRLRVYSAAGGPPTLIDDIAFTDETNIILRIKKHGGQFLFFYKSVEDTVFQQTPTPVSAAAYGYGIGTGKGIGIGAVTGGASTFDYIVNYFTFHVLYDIATNGDIYLRVVNTKITNGDIYLVIENYDGVRYLRVLQHFEQSGNTLEWEPGTITGGVLQAINGALYMITMENVGGIGVFGTEPSTSSPIPDILMQASDSTLWYLGVDPDGALKISAAPAGTDPWPALDVIMMTTPSGEYFELYIDSLQAPNYTLATKPTTPTGITPLGVTIVRKEGSYPKSITDGTVILNTSSLYDYFDGPIESKARMYYAAFQIYVARTSPAALDATMPVFVNLYKNVGHRFSRKFRGIAWSILYAWSRVIQYLVDSDITEALAQFNINKASDFFLDLWGKIFSTRRYPGEADRTYSDRVISRVLSARTTPPTIISEVLKVPGVTFCEIRDSKDQTMFVGHSFIGFSGTATTETKSDFITENFSDNPFFFTVRIKMKASTNLSQILKTIDDNKAAGTRYLVEVIAIVP